MKNPKFNPGDIVQFGTEKSWYRVEVTKQRNSKNFSGIVVSSFNNASKIGDKNSFYGVSFFVLYQAAIPPISINTVLESLDKLSEKYL